eukprot:XP_011527955.1 uncharacterized protein C21orf62 isoform X1 [Homo sapiens]
MRLVGQQLPPGCHGNDQAAGPPKTEKNSKCKTTHSTLACRLNQLSSQGEGSVARQRSVEWRGEASRWNSQMTACRHQESGRTYRRQPCTELGTCNNNRPYNESR